MALSDELEKIQSERYTLVRVTPAYRLTSFLSVKSGTIYETTLTNEFEVASVKVDGVAYDDGGVANPAAGDYYYDRSSGTFEINLNAAIGTKEVILFFYLRFTDSELGVFDANGVKNPATGAYHWESRLIDAPKFNLSVRDFLGGVTSIQASSFTVANVDNWLNSFVAGEYSYFNKECVVTLVINEVVFAKFEGKIKNIKPSNDRYSFEIYDFMADLNQPALMGDSVQEAYYNTTEFANMDTRYDGQPIPFVFGRSAFAVKVTSAGTYEFDTSKTTKAVCLDVRDSLEWGLCRTRYGNTKTLNYGTISSVSVDGAGVFSIGFTDSPVTRNIELLDTVELVKTGTGYLGVVTSISGTTKDNCTMEGQMESGAPVSVPYDSGPAVPTVSIGLMVVQGSNKFYPRYPDDYTITSTATTVGNTMFTIDFVNGWHSGHGAAALDYETDEVYFRWTENVGSPDYTTHARVVQTMLVRAGLSVDLTSITDADSDLDANINMQLPALGENEFKPYTEYLGAIMQTTFGYIYRDNSSLDVKYKLFKAPVAGNLILEEEMIGLSIEFDGKDMAETLRLKNDHTTYDYTSFTVGAGLRQEDYTFKESTMSINESTKSKYLHEITNTKTQDVVTDITSERASVKLAYCENVQMIIRFSTSTAKANLNIGDDVALAHPDIPGDKTSYSGFDCTLAKVVGIDYSADSIGFTCIDLKGL